MPVRSFNNANTFQRLMRSFAATKVGVALFRPTAHHLDRLVSKLTGGRRSFAGIATGLPAVILTTTGAKSGEPRAVAVYGIPHPDGLGLIASNWGGAKHPAWYHNLKANPRPRYLSKAIPGRPPPDPPHPASATRSGREASSCTPAGGSTKHGLANAT